MTEEKNKDIWDKASALAALFASVLVPIVIAVIGYSYTSALKESENRVKYTELAISILKDKPEKETNDVRAWAVDVINQYSGVQMDEKVRQQLLGSRLIQSDFSKSNFMQSYFNSSNFFQSSFADANFDESLFRNASFRGAIFPGADLRGADLRQAIIDSKTKLPQLKPRANK